MKILRLGHTMYVLTSKSNKSYLIDPFFDLNPGYPKEFDDQSFYQSIDGIFLTHGHLDHTSDLQKILSSNPDILVVAVYELALILMQQGFKIVYPMKKRCQSLQKEKSFYESKDLTRWEQEHRDMPPLHGEEA